MTIDMPIDYSEWVIGKMPMVVTPRDLEVIRAVTRFNQLTARQIQRLCFAGQGVRGAVVVSRRRLQLLVEGKYLRRLPFVPEGATNGAFTFIYMIPTNTSRQAKHHAIDVAEVFVTLTEAHRTERIAMEYFDPEPACNLHIGGMLLRPDAVVDVNDRYYAFELDRATESSTRIIEKLNRYQRAFSGQPTDRCPFILFIVPNEDRKRQLERVLDRHENGRDLSAVVLMDGVVDLLEQR